MTLTSSSLLLPFFETVVWLYFDKLKQTPGDDTTIINEKKVIDIKRIFDKIVTYEVTPRFQKRSDDVLYQMRMVCIY